MNFSIVVWVKSIACASILGAMGFLAAGAPVTQDVQPKPAPQEGLSGGPLPKPGDAAPKPHAPGDGDYQAIYRIFSDSPADFSDAVAAFRSAQQGADKEAKKADLKKKLTDVFDADMKARKTQAEEIEKRLNKLQEQYKAREAAKERIIDLQIEVLEKDAQGLGFPKALRDGLVKFSKPANPNFSLTALSIREGNAIEEGKKRGHFVVSNDGKYYAFVNYNSTPSRSVVNLMDALVGNLLAKYEVDGAIAEIRFQEGGVGVRMPEGKFEVRIPLDTNKNNVLPGEEGLGGGQSGGAKPLSSVAAGGGELDDYSKLRNRYLKAKEEFDRISNDWKNTVEEDRKKEPNISIAELRARYHTFTPSVDFATNAFEEATAILETKLKLLMLDVESAKANLSLSESEFSRSQAINSVKPNAVNVIELRRLQSQMDKSKIELMRAETILNLFQSIKKDAEPKPEAAKR